MHGLVLAARAVAHSVPGVRRTPRLPTVTLVRKVVVDRAHVTAYARTCGFSPPVDVVPATYPHVLGFPLQVELTTRRDFGLRVLGSVHLAQEVVVRRPVRVGDRLTLRTHVEGLRPHRRGQAFDVVTEALVGGEVAWTGRSTYLARGDGDPSLPRETVPELVTPGGVPWLLPADLGRRYARVSGDWNPIHLSGLTARPFGFRRPIAHGMWSLARCVAALEGRLPPTVRVTATFRRPVLLPSTVFLGEATHGSSYGFGLFDVGERAHLLGEASSVDAG